MSDQSSTLSVVHEAIDERQHVRVKIPATVSVNVSGKVIECEVEDISLGGASIFINQSFVEGQLIDTTVSFNLDGFDMNLPIKAKVISQKGKVTSIGFVDVAQKQMDTLRYMISSFIAGDIVSASGVLNVVQRENYIKQRKTKFDATRSWSERAKAIFGTATYLVFGSLIALILAYKLYIYFFQVNALNSSVSADSFIVSMPGNGYVSYLTNKDEVEKGEPLASVSSQLQTSFNTPEDLRAISDISETDLQTLFGKALLETMIASPCDCFVYYPEQASDRYAYKEEELLHLLPVDKPLYVKATFPFTRIDALNNSSEINIRIFGHAEPTKGKIVRSEVDSKLGNLVLLIEPLEPLAKEDYLKPAEVSIDTGWGISKFWQ